MNPAIVASVNDWLVAHGMAPVEMPQTKTAQTVDLENWAAQEAAKHDEGLTDAEYFDRFGFPDEEYLDDPFTEEEVAEWGLAQVDELGRLI